MRALVLLALTPGLAWAEDALRVELVAKALAGQAQPALVVHAEAPLEALTLEVSRSSDQKRLVQSVKSVKAGASHRFALELAAPGKARFEGRLAARVRGEPVEMPIAVDAELLAPIELSVAPEDVDLERRTLAVTASRPVVRVEAALVSDRGAELGTFDGLADGARATMSWPELGGAVVLRMSVRAYDADGFFGAIELFPWRVDIPHEEVNFASGSAEVPPSEAGKLDASLEQIQAAVKRFGKLAAIQLFVAGHTDTVGDAGANQALSERRAQSIARAFLKKGLKIPVQAAGFGEELPLVKTADEVDEPKNRRAEYIVAVEPPSLRGKRPWRPVK